MQSEVQKSFFIINFFFELIMRPHQTVFRKNNRGQIEKKRKEEDKPQHGEKHWWKHRLSLVKLKDQMVEKIQKVQVPKKFVKFVRKNARLLPNLLTKEESRKLLPQLEKISLISKEAPQKQDNDIKFRRLESELSSNLVEFVQSAETERTEIWAIEIQTKKCYQHIPSFYFKELDAETLEDNLNLSSSSEQIRESMYKLMDYADEVEFNINQQVGAKIKIYMKFVLCMNSITQLIDMNLGKIAATRRHNNILRDIIVSRSVRINHKRKKKEMLEKVVKKLQMLKKMKNMENKIMNYMSLGMVIPIEGKHKIRMVFQQYCQVHKEMKKACCHGLCKFWDICYYVDKSYQENFIKMMRTYMFQIISPEKDIETYRKSLNHTHNKKAFMTTPSHSSSSFDMGFDESYEVDFDVEIPIKQNVERQIGLIFQQGMGKYTYCTDSLNYQLNQQLLRFKNLLMKELMQQIQKGGLKNNSQTSILPEQTGQELPDEAIQKTLKKTPLTQFEKICQIIINRLQCINKRTFSMINILLLHANALNQSQPDRYGVITAYFIQIIQTLTAFMDNTVSFIISSRVSEKREKSSLSFRQQNEKINEFQTEKMKKLLNFCKKSQSQINYLKRWNPFVKKQYQEMSKKDIDGWIPKIVKLKSEIVKYSYDKLHKSITSKHLKEKLAEDNWQPISLSIQVHSCIGYIIAGDDFIKEEQKKQKDMLSSSLLLQKQLSQLSETSGSPSYNKKYYSSNFKVNPYFITLDSKQYKITSSTEQMLFFLHHYLELYDQIPNDGRYEGKKFQLHGKVTELILMYNEQIKSLILHSQALKNKQIKNGAITARHLLIAFVQLSIIEIIFCGKVIQERIEISEEQCQFMHEKIQVTMSEIQNKFRKILYERIELSIKKIKDFENEARILEPILKNYSQSFQLFQDILPDDKSYSKFMDIGKKETNWIDLLINSLKKQGKDKEFRKKWLRQIELQLRFEMSYLPNLKQTIQTYNMN